MINWKAMASDIKVIKRWENKSVRGLASDLDMPTSSIQRVLSGSPLDADNFMKVCHHFRFDPIKYYESGDK